jgi:hypothetical protein
MGDRRAHLAGGLPVGEHRSGQACPTGRPSCYKAPHASLGDLWVSHGGPGRLRRRRR